MMSKKKTYVPLSLDLTSFKSSSNCNWEDIEDDDCGTVLDPNAIARIRGELPNAPRAARYEQMVENIPEEGPFRIKISNVPFTCNEQNVEKFFVPLVPINVSLRINRNNSLPNKHRGFGFVDFNTRNDLILALQQNGKLMSGRSVNIELAEPEPPGRENSGSFQKDDRRFNRPGSIGGQEQSAADSQTNWRRKPVDPPPQHFQSERESYPQDNYRGSNTFQRRAPPNNASFRDGHEDTVDNAADGSDNWRKKQPSPPFQQPERPPMTHYDDHRGGDRGRGSRFPRGGSVHSNSSQRFSDAPSRQDSLSHAPPGFEAPRERPRFTLDKRTLETNEPVSRPANIFGQAKPVDTASKDLQIEEKLIAEKEHLKRQLEHQQDEGMKQDVESCKDVSHPASEAVELPRPIVVKQRLQSTSSSTGESSKVPGHSLEPSTYAHTCPVDPPQQKSSHAPPDSNRLRNQNFITPTIPEQQTSVVQSAAPVSQVNSWRAPQPHVLSQEKIRQPHVAPFVSTTSNPATSDAPPRATPPVSAVPSMSNAHRNPPTVVRAVEPPPQPTSFIRPHISYSDIAKSKLDSAANSKPAQPPTAGTGLVIERSVDQKEAVTHAPAANVNIESNVYQPQYSRRVHESAEDYQGSQGDGTYRESHARGRGNAHVRGSRYGGDYHQNGDEDGPSRGGRYRGSGSDRPYRSGRGGRGNYPRYAADNDRNSPQPSFDSMDNRSNSEYHSRGGGNHKWQPRGGRYDSENRRPMASSTSEK